MLMSSRRSFLTGLGASIIAAPAIVRADSLLPLRGILMPCHEIKLYAGALNFVDCDTYYDAIYREVIKDGLARLKRFPELFLWSDDVMSSAARD